MIRRDSSNICASSSLFIPEGYQKFHRVHVYDRKLRREGYQPLDEVDDLEANKLTVEKILNHKVDPADHLDEQIEKRRRQLKYEPKFPRVTDYFLMNNADIIQERMQGIVTKLTKEMGGDIFEHPVDVEEVPDYLNFITNPMDLGTISTRLGRESYYIGPSAVSLFASDVRLVFQNCKTYNAEGSDIWRVAAELLRTFEKWIYDWILSPSAWLKLPPSGDAEEDQRLQKEFRDEAEAFYDLWAPYRIGCCICGNSNNSEELLLCDRCDGEVHMHCATPNVTELPEGEWFCGYCRVRKKFTGKMEKAKEESEHKLKSIEIEASTGVTTPSASGSTPTQADKKATTTSTHAPNILMERADGEGKVNKKTSKRSPKGISATKSLAPISMKDRAGTFFLVKWMGLSVRFSTWERPEDIGDDEQIQRYFKFSRVPSAKEIRETTCQLPCCAKRHQYALVTATSGKRCCEKDRFCTLGNGHEGNCSRSIKAVGGAYGSIAYQRLHMQEQVKAQLFAFHCLLNNHTPDKDVLKQCGMHTNAYVTTKQHLAPKALKEDDDEDYSDEDGDSSDDDADFDAETDFLNRPAFYPGILTLENDDEENDDEAGGHKKKTEEEVGEVLSSIVEHVALGYPTKLETVSAEFRFDSIYPASAFNELPAFTEYCIILGRSPLGLGMRLGISCTTNVSVLGFQPLANGMIGPAQASGAISIGDVLVAVNKISVAGRSFQDVVTLIGASSHQVLFHFHSPRPAFMYPPYCQAKQVTKLRLEKIPDDAAPEGSKYAQYSYNQFKRMLKVGVAEPDVASAASTQTLMQHANYSAPSGPMQHLYAGVVDNSIDPHEHFASFLPERSNAANSGSHAKSAGSSGDANEFVPYEQSPTYKGGRTLRAYQVEGLNWMVSCIKAQRSCILADEMGLGKTVQIVSLIEHMKSEESIRGPYLIVVPLSTIQHWRREIESWTDLNVCVYHDIGDRSTKFTAKDMRAVVRDQEWYYPGLGNSIFKFHILLTTFETILADFEEFEHIHWRLVVVDEAHRLKSAGSRVLKMMRVLHVDRKVLLTGTPLQNNTQELWVLLNYLEPVKFASLEEFNQNFGKLHSQEQVVRLQQLLAPFILRRVKEDVEKSIPPKEETIVSVELTTLQKQYYRAIYDKNKSFLYRGTKNGLPTLNNIQLQLRKCCNHPFLIKGVEERELDELGSNPTPAQVMEKTIECSGKMMLVSKLIPKLKRDGHKILIFSQFLKQLDLLERYCEANSFVFERLDGSTGGSVRQSAIDRFSRPHSKSFIFLLSTKAGGVGINLIAADTVIIFDSDWNPMNDLQAQSRCHRIGQKKSVQIYRLVTRNTYESEMFDRASRKLGLEHAVLGTASFNENSQITKPSAEQLVELLKRGAYALMEDDDTASKEFAERDIETILKENARVLVVGGSSNASKSADGDTGGIASPKQKKSPLKSNKRKSLGGMAIDRSSFVAEGSTGELSVDDPNFWEKVLPGAVSVEMLSLKLEDGSAVNSRQSKIKFISNLDIALTSLVAEMSSGNSSDDGRHGSRDIQHEYDIAIQVLNTVSSKYRDEFSNDQIDLVKGYLTKLEKSRVRSCRLAPARTNLFQDEDFDTPKKKRRRRSTPAGSRAGSEDEAYGNTPVKKRGRGRPPKHPRTEDANPPIALFQGGIINETDDLCTLCGDGGLILLCDGPCHRSFHLDCVGMKDEPNDEQWLCPDCAEGRHMCLICKQVGEMGVEFGVTQCSVAKCGRFYHKGCLAENSRVEWVGKKRFRCPSHFCHACSKQATTNSNKKGEDNTGLVSCIHCSQAFHPDCIPSADKFIRLSKNLMICANHVDGKKAPGKISARASGSAPAAQRAGAVLAAASTQLEIPQHIPLEEDEAEQPEKSSGKRKREPSPKRPSSSGSKKSKPAQPTNRIARQKVCALCHRGDVMGGDSTGTDTADMALEGPFIEAPVRLKYTDRPNESVHVHLNCAVHSPEVYVKADGLIMNLPKAIKRGRQLKCTSCHKFGATVGCVVAKCRRNYHLRCAVESGGEIDGTTYALYCKPHAAARKEPTRVCVCDTNEEDPKLTLVCSSCDTKFHPKCVNMSERHAARMAKTWICGVCDGSAAAKPAIPTHMPAKATADASPPKRKKVKKNRLSMPRNKIRSKANGTNHGISPHMADSDSGVSTDE
ncbi:chromodomain-helicase-DNA-binding protein, putative [Phytophthora infestans T30-4]|uniref:Chromodomain-helicase-DNA-binding protein, putative n=1 Tax=Phytophthora infestans (strain T30-4) TaxID=403677 RepID=D0N059_PHYIT|nr:chromodomain-helicase-DNA-binding protein, putative [Phytophthora infestans T30-4]EEY65872.1 chromodomain-helicase-DNA-binding protein, putative [Phytophthora infestans T30-4]|eukprot:XP_002906471.1 chromodomain-helicase-DNA-binding protein, putative [Phytophthora infestans T30-4]